MKRLVRGEKGYVLIAALLVLVVLGLISGPLLSYMVSGLRAGHVFETGAAELYAADAGVEDAAWKIQHPLEAGYLPCSASDTPRVYNITDVNGKVVEVTIEYAGEGDYRVTSIAVTYDGGNTAAINSSTAVEAYIDGTPFDYSSITDHILCSNGTVDWKKKVSLCYTEGHGPAEYFQGYWPTPAQLALFYWQDVKDEEPYSLGTIDLDGVNMNLGPIYRDGPLEILNSNNTPATLTLNGTLYITGEALIGQNGKMDALTIDLNGQTIFVESSSADALVVGGKCTIRGPGCVIAVGDIFFGPKGDVGSNQEPVFIFSVAGTTKLNPSGDFYGAIAGCLWVDVNPGYTPTITYPPDGFGDDDLNLPGFGDLQLLTYSITSWQVSRQ